MGEFAPHPFTHQDHISWVSHSCLTLISERFPYHLDGNSGCLETSLDQSKRLLQGSRVQSWFGGNRTMPYTPVSCGTVHFLRGTRTLPYAYWGSECQSERAPAWRENACWSCVLDRTSRVREWMKKFEEGRRPSKGRSGNNETMGTEGERQRCTDKTAKMSGKWWQLRDKSCHPVRKDWFFCSTWQFFEEITILWRVSSIWNYRSAGCRLCVSSQMFDNCFRFLFLMMW